MKKGIAILLLAAVLLLTACGSRPAPTEPEKTPETLASEPEQTTEAPEPETLPEIWEPEYPGIYCRTWSEEIGGKEIALNAYIVLKEDGAGFWIAQDVGTLTWDESQLTLTVGAVYDIALTEESGTENLLVYEFQDEEGTWLPTVFQEIESLPAEIEEMLTRF